jgi:hypothetical protein
VTTSWSAGGASMASTDSDITDIGYTPVCPAVEPGSRPTASGGTAVMR